MPEKTTQKEHGKKTAPPSEKEVQPEVVIQIPLAELHPFPDHPFQVNQIKKRSQPRCGIVNSPQTTKHKEGTSHEQDSTRGPEPSSSR